MNVSALRQPIPLLVVALLTLSFLYSFLIMAQPLVWVGAVVPLIGLYLFWRFVRSHERIADAMESGASSAPSGPDEP